MLCEKCGKSIDASEYQCNHGLCDECDYKTFRKKIRRMVTNG